MDDDVINLSQIFAILKKHLALILIMMGLGGILATGATYFVMTPQYQSSSLMLVNQKSTSDSAMQYNQIQTDLQMINTYKDIITQSVVLNQVKKNLHKNGFVPQDDLASAISLSNNENSQVVKVTATAKDPYLARAIANEVVKVFQTKITTIMANAKNVSIVAEGTLEKAPVSPRPKINIAVGLLAGLVLGVLVAFIRELTDKTVREPAFVEDALDLPLLGSISEIDTQDMKLGASRTGQIQGRKSRSRR
ncbi:YveK family protein [Lacticaseibacillus kribbianus]|uniref:YveK family protein n=1 Tax=Lacticaseibacillus kribbianus TaxID=2926292 RepID=UPI001CD28275|nr:Wzz/FepE/Etk N-terminal domain-containing protein [Lacticaseibacillus kribbianus]